MPEQPPAACRPQGICYPALMIHTRQRWQVLAFYFVFPVLFGLFVSPSSVSQQVPAAGAAAARAATTEEFLQAADEVLQQVSDVTHLALRAPLKKTLRSREEIRAYVLRQMKEDKTAKERHAAEQSAKAFGLVPKDFQMEAFLVDLLTEQIAGLYDPESHEFYIADWIPVEDQRMVMAHELTHALEDQHFQVEKWVKAARPNDDAELAREAVLEGSAMAAMIDYVLKDSGHSLRDLPDINPEILVGELGNTPTMAKAPEFLKDALIFPYFAGMRFTKDALQQSGWESLPALFAKPPVSTQQIMHPRLYHEGRAPAAVDLPVNEKLLRGSWERLDENALGEFGWKEVLQQFLGRDRAVPLAAEWSGDRYILLEDGKTKKLLLVCRVRLSSSDAAARFFGQYSEALEKKHHSRKNLFRRSNFFSFDTLEEGGVFLRCMNEDCLVLEGGDRAAFDAANKAIGWAAAPVPPELPQKAAEKIARIPRTLRSGSNDFAASPGP